MADSQWKKYSFYGAAALAIILLALALPAKKHGAAPTAVKVGIAFSAPAMPPLAQASAPVSVPVPVSAPVPTSPSQPTATPVAGTGAPTATPQQAGTPPVAPPSAPAAAPSPPAQDANTQAPPPQAGPPVTSAPRLPVEQAGSIAPVAPATARPPAVAPTIAATVSDVPAPPSTPITTASPETQPAPAAAAPAPPPEAAQILVDAPQPDLVEKTSQGLLLPVRGTDTRASWLVYRRHYMGPPGKPKIAIAIAGLGLDKVMTASVISELPPDISLIFDPYAADLSAWVKRARGVGHEAWLSIPMEPIDYPRDDPGPNTLLTKIPPNDNLTRLYWALGQATGYVGLTTLSGTQFANDENSMTPIMQEISSRGLAWIDAGGWVHSATTEIAHKLSVPTCNCSLRLDEKLTPEAIHAALAKLVAEAKKNGREIGVIWAPTPLMIEELQKFLPTLAQDGVYLAPVTTLLTP